MTSKAETRRKDANSPFPNPIVDYGARLMEFGFINASAAFEGARRLASAKSPPEYFDVLTELTREQFERMSEQIAEMSMLTQPGAKETTDKTGTAFWE